MQFGETKITKDQVYHQRPISIWNVNGDNVVTSKLVKTKINSKYLIGYLDKVIKPLVLIVPKMSECNKTFKLKDRDKDKNNKLMSFHIDSEKLLEKYETTWTKIEGLKVIELISLQFYHERYIKCKTRTYGDNVYTNTRALNAPEDDIECRSFTVFSIKNKYYLQVNINNHAYKIASKEIADYLHDNPFED